MKIHIALSCIIPVVVLLQACTKSSRDGDEQQQQHPVVQVVAGAVRIGDIAVTVEATGRTDALRKEKILAPAAGWVVSLKALDGTRFAPGEVMAILRPKESQAAITGAEAMLQRAQTEEQKTEARHALDIARSSQPSVEIKAKFYGSVAAQNVTQGELVAENAELFTLIDLSTIVFIADIPLNALPGIHTGEHAIIRFDVMGDKKFHATVEALNPQTDVQSQTVKSRLRIEDVRSTDRALLRTNMMGTVHITTAVHKQALLIPRSALLRDDETNTYSVVLIGRDSLSQSVPVTVGVLTDSIAEITHGISKDMTIINQGNYALPDSTRVTVMTQEHR